MGALDSWNHESAGAIGFGHVNSDTQVDVGGVNGDGFALNLFVKNILTGKLPQRLDHGPGDEVGEGNFAAASAAQMVVHDYSVIDHQLGRHGSNAGSGRDLKALVHVRSESLCHALQRRNFIAGFRSILNRCFRDHEIGGGGGLGRNGLFLGTSGGGFGNGGRYGRGVTTR